MTETARERAARWLCDRDRREHYAKPWGILVEGERDMYREEANELLAALSSEEGESGERQAFRAGYAAAYMVHVDAEGAPAEEVDAEWEIFRRFRKQGGGDA